ncbi:MAG: sirohydrochlorin chelatase [Acidiferrobacter sp.]
MSQVQFLLVHGSRNPQWRLPFEVIAARLQTVQPQRRIILCYMEIWTPSLTDAMHQAYAEGLRQYRISPLFLSCGRHLQEDLPALVERLQAELPDCGIVIDGPLGTSEIIITATLQALQ